MRRHIAGWANRLDAPVPQFIVPTYSNGTSATTTNVTWFPQP